LQTVACPASHASPLQTPLPVSLSPGCVFWCRDGVDDPLEDHALVTQQLDQVRAYLENLTAAIFYLGSYIKYDMTLTRFVSIV